MAASMNIKARYSSPNTLRAPVSPENAAHNLALNARSVCHHVSRGYFDELRHMATETKGIATLDNVNSAIINPATIGS